MMSSGKQRLRPWLEDMISKGEIDGLRWMNSEKTKFRIPWKHGGKQDWSPENSRIFMEWARHTGKYREGIDEPNYPTWKTRLRCAFNKAQDIEEVRSESRLSCHEPFRVYVLKEAKRSRTTSLKSKDTKGLKPINREDGEKLEEDKEEEEEYDVWGNSSVSVKKESSNAMIPSTVEEMDPVEDPATERQYSSDFEAIFCGELDEEFGGVVLEMEQFGREMNCQDDETFSANESGALNNALTLESEQTFMPLSRLDHGHLEHLKVNCFMKLEAFYCRKLVHESVYNLQSGLRIAVTGHAASEQSPSVVIPSVVDKLLKENPPTMYLPLCGNLPNSPLVEQVIDHVLTKSLTEGLLLWMNDEADIFAYRFCRGAIFHVSQSETDGKSVKIPLNRDKPEFVKIFSFKDCFGLEPDSFADLHLPESCDPTVYLCCGEPGDFKDIPQKALICIKLTPAGYQGFQHNSNSANHVIKTMGAMSPFDGPSSIDNISCDQFGLESDIELQTSDE